MENRYIINLDFKTNAMTIANFKQCDANTSVLEIHVLNGGVPVDITGQTVKLNFKRSDNSIVTQDSTNGVSILSAPSGIIQCVLASNTLAVAGETECEVVFTLNGDVLTTANFVFNVQTGIGILSINYIASINEQLETWQSTFNSNEAIRQSTFDTRESARQTAFSTMEHVDANLELSSARQGHSTLLENLQNKDAQLAGKANQADLVVERNRISNLTTLAQGSTTGDAELIDSRIGADGITYKNSGEAIRGQCGKINTNLISINPDLTENLQYAYDTTLAKKSLSGNMLLLLPYAINPYYSAKMEVYVDQVNTAYVFLINQDRTKITAKKQITLVKGINVIDISDIKNKNTIEYIGISSPSGGFTYNSDGTTATQYDFNYYYSFSSVPNVNDSINVAATDRSRLCCNFYILVPSKSAKNDDLLSLKTELGVDTTILTSLKSDCNEDIPMPSCANDWIFVLGINSTISKNATKVKLDIYSKGGLGTVYLITKTEHLIKYKCTTTFTNGINSLEIDVTSFTDELMIALYSNDTGAFCQQSGSTYEYSNTDPMTYYGAWQSNYSVGDTISLTYWEGNINTNKTYLAIDVYVSEPIEKRKSNIITVSPSGNADYITIKDAVRNAGDIDNPTKILLYPGIYDEVVYLRNKHNISIEGLIREKCIIVNRTGKYCNTPLMVNGDFELKNLTLKMTLDNVGTYTPIYDSNNVFVTYPGYALHIDGESKDKTKQTVGRVINCTCYSEAFPAVGMGVNQNQKVIFENCEFIRNCTVAIYKQDDWKGAFIGHSSNASSAINQNLVLKDCIFKSNYGYSGNLRANLGDSASFTLTAINNTFYSDENGVNSFEYIKGTSTLNPISHGNTATNLNVF